MRPRHVAILAVLAAIPVGLALALTGGGAKKSSGAGSSAQLSLQLVGGSSPGPMAACGITHHYTEYPAGSTIAFRGKISTPGSWSVKLKLKACTAGAFRSSGNASAKVRRDGSYKGTFPAPIVGAYFARAELRRQDAVLARSEKRYFEVR